MYLLLNSFHGAISCRFGRELKLIINNNIFIYSPISHRVQWTVQKLKHNISTYVRNITIKEIIKIAQLMNTVKREKKSVKRTHEHAKDHSHQMQQLINQRVSCTGVFFSFFLKESTEDACLTSRGSLFHSVGAANVKERFSIRFFLENRCIIITMLELSFSWVPILAIWCNKFR